jgi:diguanylate cyclase (GGDEF)-like protein/PAS domain S-box-containing protein
MTMPGQIPTGVRGGLQVSMGSSTQVRPSLEAAALDQDAGALRAAALERTGLLERQAEEAFDRLTRLAARLTGAHIGLLNLVTADRLRVKSAQTVDGPAFDEPHDLELRHSGACRYVISTGQPVASTDVRVDPRLADYPAPDLKHVSAYAGVPVYDGDGQRLGTLCVICTEPYTWPAHTLATLEDLAELVTTELRFRASVNESNRRTAELESLESIVEASQNAIIGKRLDGTITYWSAGAQRLYGYTREEAVGHSITMLAAAPDQASEFDAIHATVARGETVHRSTVRRRKDGSLVDVEVAICPLRDSAGRVVAASTSAIDITARLEAQRAERRLARLLAEAQEISTLGSWERDIATGTTVWTDQMYEIFGLRPSDFPAGDLSGFRALIHPDDYEVYEEILEGIELTGTPGEAECRIVRTDGTIRILHTRARLTKSVDGDKLVGTTQDVTSQRVLERELTKARDLFSGVLDAATETLIVSTDADGVIRVFNRGAERMLGHRAQDVVGIATPEIFHDPAEVVQRAAELGIQPGFEVFVQAAREGRAESREWTFIRRDRTTLTVSLTITATRNAAGAVTGYIGVAVDVSEARAAEQAKGQAERRFHAAFEHAPIGVALIDLHSPKRGSFIQTNPALARLLGREPGDLDGMTIEELTHPLDHDKTDDKLERLDLGQSVTVEKRFLHTDGHELWVLVSCTPVPTDDGGEGEYAVAQIVDISERRRFEKQLRHLADHDALTGLYNRHRFESELERVVSEAHRYGRRAALLMLDLDGFKHVNDRFGHPIGDELVSRIGGLLRATVRATDVVARLGGDEFAIILQEAGEKEAVTVAENILDAIRRRGVVMSELRHARVTTSVGITTFDQYSQLTGEELIVEADIAMYDAKAAGRNRHASYDRSVNRREIDSKHHAWLDRLRSAVENDLFVLFAQEITDISGSGTTQFELLLRMRDEFGDLIPPGAFLYNAERFDLMGEIDRWVLRNAVKLLHDHHAAGNDISLAVNLSGKTMNDVALPADLAAMLAEHPIPEGRLIIEVTETAAIVNIDRARELARELRQMGCRFALDDFGAGFASFYYLKHLAFDYLKIDGEFIKKLTTTPTDQLVVRAVVEIAKGLGTETVAEFVGDAETLDMLRGLGVDYGQGFYLGRPGPLAENLPPLEPPQRVLAGA